MVFKATIEMDNAAFDDAPAGELARVLEEIARRVWLGGRCGVVYDINGNDIGEWFIEDETGLLPGRGVTRRLMSPWENTMGKKYDAIGALVQLGFDYNDATALRRISMALRRWYEHKCNGAIQRDEKTGKPYWYNADTGRELFPVADRERGAKKRLAKIMGRYPAYGHYLQTDPRGCALYILRAGDVPHGEYPGAYYSRGIPVY